MVVAITRPLVELPQFATVDALRWLVALWYDLKDIHIVSFQISSPVGSPPGFLRLRLAMGGGVADSALDQG